MPVGKKGQRAIDGECVTSMRRFTGVTGNVHRAQPNTALRQSISGYLNEQTSVVLTGCQCGIHGILCLGPGKREGVWGGGEDNFDLYTDTRLPHVAQAVWTLSDQQAE